MCGSAPSAPSIPEPKPLPAPKPLPTAQQSAPAPVVAPPAPLPAQVQAPPPKQVDPEMPAPPPTLVQGGDDTEPVVKQRKSKRREVQQASKGTAALRIPLNTGATEAAGGNTGGLNIPTNK